MSVFDLKAGDSAVIKKINISGGAEQRLSSLGIVVGKRVEVLAFSLFKSGVLLGCGAVRLGVRKLLASKIEVEVCD